MKIKIGLISPNDFRPWCTLNNWSEIVKKEKILAEALKKRGYRVIFGRQASYIDLYPGLEYFSEKRVGQVAKREIGKKLKGLDQTAWRTGLIRTQVDYLIGRKVKVIVVHQADWTWPQRTSEIITRLTLSKNPPGLVMFSFKDTRVPGLVAGMAARGAALRLGKAIEHAFGRPDDRLTLDWLCHLIDKNGRKGYNPDLIFKKKNKGRRSDKKFKKRVKDFKTVAYKIANEILPRQKCLAIGTTGCLDMDTTEIDPLEWRKIFKVGVKQLDQSAVDYLADKLVAWRGRPGESDYEIKDEKVKKLVKAAFNNFKFFEKSKLLKRRMVLQIASYRAMQDLFGQHEATFGGIKCQDEESACRTTQCLGAAYLNNDSDIDGSLKQIIPFACENDLDQALTQLLMYLISLRTAGFGDFRDVEYEDKFKDKRARLAIVNCGQHPPCYFDGPTEILKQEHFYPKAGTAVRGRTPGGLEMTVGRLARINGRYILVATVMETEKVDIKTHDKYNVSWPIIVGKLPKGLNAKQMIGLWPSNHLGFTKGDITAELLALAEELKIGYQIIDKKGIEYYKNPDK